LQFNLTTFLLEIANFLVLVWLLKRFFYLPVRDMIDMRRRDIEKQMAEASSKMSEAETIKQQYENRLVAWDDEKREARVKLQEELNREQTRQLDNIRQVVEQEREKARVLAEREYAENLKRSQTQALALAADFAARLLNDVASPDLESQLIDLFVKQLPTMSQEFVSTLQQNYIREKSPIKITTAFSVSENTRETLQRVLSDIVAAQAEINYSKDDKLIAGIRVNIGPLVLRANIQDELQFFTEAAHAGE